MGKCGLKSVALESAKYERYPLPEGPSVLLKEEGEVMGYFEGRQPFIHLLSPGTLAFCREVGHSILKTLALQYSNHSLREGP